MRFYHLGLVLVSWLVSLEANGAGSFKDWKTAEAQDEILATSVCNASTEKLTGPVAGSLVVHFPKDQKYAPYITIRVPKVDGEAPITSVALMLNAKETNKLLYFNAEQTPPTQHSYWALPLHLLSQMNLIEQLFAAEVVVEKAGVLQKSKISLSGSSAALQDAKRCAGYQPDYVKWLVQKPEREVAPRIVTLEELFVEYQNASQKFAERKTVETQLLAKKEAMKVLVKQERDATAVLTQRTTALSASTKSLADHDLKISNSESRLVLAGQEQQTFEAALPLAEKVLGEKEAIYKPIKQGEYRLIGIYNTYYARKQEIEGDIQNLSSAISNAQSEISSLQQESQNLSNENFNLRSQERDLERRYQDAQREHDNYDVLNEVRRQENSSWELRNAEQDAHRAHQEAEKFQRQEREAEQEKHRTQQRLQECRQVTPPKDCSDIERRLNDVTREAMQARSNADSAERSAHHIRDRIHRIRNQIENEVRHVKNQLQARKDMTYRDWSMLRDRLAQNQNRMDSILNSQIPNLRNQVQSDQSQLNQLRSELPNVKANIQRAQADLDKYRLDNNLKQVEQEYTTARTERDQIRNNIAARKQEIAKLQRDLPVLKNQRVSLEKDLNAKTQQYAVASQALADIQAKLAPDRQKESALQQVVDQLTVDLNNKKEMLLAGFAQHWTTVSPSSILNEYF